MLLARTPQTVDEIANFHGQIEAIQPFQTGSGHVSRLIALEQSLAAGLPPTIFEADRVDAYRIAVAAHDQDPATLRDLAQDAQAAYAQRHGT